MNMGSIMRVMDWIFFAFVLLGFLFTEKNNGDLFNNRYIELF